MPSRAEIVSFADSALPPGADRWVPGTAPTVGIEVTDPDPAWPRQYDELADRIREALGWRVLQLEHVGSTAVPGLAAKPVIDIDLTVADPGREQDYVPALEAIGFRLVIREPWRYGHRALVADQPRCNLHVYGFDSAELVRHRIFRDWLRGNPEERERYAAAKREAASAASAAGEHVMQYNARKQQIIREIYHRAFAAAGLLEDSRGLRPAGRGARDARDWARDHDSAEALTHDRTSAPRVGRQLHGRHAGPVGHRQAAAGFCPAR